MTIGLRNKNGRGRGKIRIPWYSVLFWLLPIVWEPRGELLLPLVSALLHELGHYGAAYALGVGVERITVYPFGADMRLSSALRSYRTDLLIAAQEYHSEQSEEQNDANGKHFRIGEKKHGK